MSDVLEMLRMLAVQYGLQILGALAILIIGRWVAHWLVNLLRRVLDTAGVDETLARFLGNVLNYLLLVIVVVIALSVLGIPTTSVVAILGAMTLAIGLALQDSLGNLAAGVMIILLRPYRLGDYIKTNDAEGFVTAIQIFHTTLLTRDSKTVFVPNKDVLGNNIVNYSKTEWTRLDLVYGIGYGDDLRQARRILEAIIADEPRIAANPAPSVAVKGLGDSSVDLIVRAYVKVADMVAVDNAFTEQVKLRFDAEGISIPFPQRDVHLYQN